MHTLIQTAHTSMKLLKNDHHVFAEHATSDHTEGAESSYSMAVLIVLPTGFGPTGLLCTKEFTLVFLVMYMYMLSLNAVSKCSCTLMLKIRSIAISSRLKQHPDVASQILCQVLNNQCPRM